MSGVYKYKNAIGATTSFDVDLGTDVIRLGQILGFEQRAEHLASGSTTIVFDNPDADLGHDNDQLLGNQLLYATESAAPSGNQRLYTGIIGVRNYARGDSSRASLRTGASNQVTTEIHDLNTLPSLRVIPQSDRTAIRPRETVSARMTWIMATTYMSNVTDAGLIAASGKFASKADYRGQRAVNVINDCELAAGFGWNAFVYWDETGGAPALFFDNANTSTAYSSTLSLSNVLSDQSSTCLMAGNAVLRRDPADLGDRAYMPFRNGYVYRHRAATTDTYGNKDIIAPNSNVARRDRAREIADDILFQHSTETDTITCTVDVPAAQSTLIRAGHRILVRFSHLPGYESFTYCRITMCAPGQQHESDQFYTFTLALSPMEAAAPYATIVQSVFGRVTDGDSTPTFPAPVTIGNYLVFAIGQRGHTDPGPPNYMDAGQPRWGSGAWTRMNGATLTTSDVDGAAFYYKVADATDQTCLIPEDGAGYGCWELSGADVPSATLIDVDDTISGPDYTTGTLSVGVGELAMAVWIFGDADWPWGGPGAPPSGIWPWAQINPTPGLASGWTREQSQWAYDNYSSLYYKVEHAWTTIADAIGSGATLSATITPGLSGKSFGGIAIKIPAA